MTDNQWQLLLDTVNGKTSSPPVGFIIDSPWLPGWCGMSMLDYYSSDEAWLDANLKAARAFPTTLFLPGFWPEFGMCTEPSAFGGRSVWSRTQLPHHEKVLRDDFSNLGDLPTPNVETDGLLPLALNRAIRCEPAIREAGHAFRIATSRGPLNIASFLMGTTELMMATQLSPDKTHELLSKITTFVIDWLRLQQETFPTTQGVFLLDDLIGFLGEGDFRTFALPYLKRIYDAFDVPVKFLHNDAPGLVTAAHLAEIGVNLFNFSHDHGMQEMRDACGDSVTLLGNIPPRDVLAGATPDAIADAVRKTKADLQDPQRVILSCGGGVPPDVSTDQMRAFIAAALS